MCQSVSPGLNTVKCFNKVINFHLSITPYAIWISIVIAVDCFSNQLPVNEIAGHPDSFPAEAAILIPGSCAIDIKIYDRNRKLLYEGFRQ